MKKVQADLLAIQIEKDRKDLVLLQSRLREAIRKKEIQDANQKLRLLCPASCSAIKAHVILIFIFLHGDTRWGNNDPLIVHSVGGFFVGARRCFGFFRIGQSLQSQKLTFSAAQMLFFCFSRTFSFVHC